MNFNLTSALKGITPVAINEFRLVNARLAQVIISSMFPMESSNLLAAVNERLPDGASAVKSSFRWMNSERTVAHGFVSRVNSAVLLDGNDPTSQGFRLVASNMYLAEEDSATWELRSGATGSYMVRHGQDDLSELLTASVSQTRGSVRLSSVVAATAQANEFVAFVNCTGQGTPAVDYGFCTASSDQVFQVVTSSGDVVPVRSAEMVSAHMLNSDEIARLYQQGRKNDTTAGVINKPNVVDYYTKLYGYAPDYLKLVVKEIEELAAM